MLYFDLHKKRVTMTHTKGEWKIVKNKMSTSIKGICILTSGFSEVNKANAKLIAAAPKLLKALTAIRNQMWGEYREPWFEEWVKEANEAISKATD